MGARRRLSDPTSCVHAVAKFSPFSGRSPDQVDLEDVRAFQAQYGRVSRRAEVAEAMDYVFKRWGAFGRPRCLDA
jgi:hypothetical protein